MSAWRRPGLPVLPLVMEMPLLREPDPDLLAAYYDAMAEATVPTDGTEQATPPRPTRGRPRTNLYVAAELAYMADIEQRASFTSPPEDERWQSEPTDRAFSALTQRGYLDPQSMLTWDESQRAYKAQKLKRTRSQGRRVLAELGAWPWAVAPDGRLPRDWRDDERYVAALAAWAGVEFDATLMPRGPIGPRAV